jgi:hypothetical protein
MEIFRDYFTAESLTDSLANAAYVPGQTADLYETRGIGSTTLAIEALDDSGPNALTAIPRGAPLPAMALDKRSVVTFALQTYGTQGAVYADEVLNARSFGTSGAGQIVATRRDETVAKLRRNIDNLHESLRMAVVLEPDNGFGSNPAEASIALGADATKTRAELFTKIIQPMESALGGVIFSGIRVLCSDGYWASIIENKAIKDSYLLAMEGAEVRGDPRQAFTWGGVTFERYRGSSTVKITDNKAVAVPMGVSGLFIQAFGPDDTFDSVGAGAMGAPYYVRAFDMDDAKGWRIRAQTHCKMVCTRPTAILPLAFT